MSVSINIFLFVLIGACVGYLYCWSLWKTLQKLQTVQKKGLFLLFTTILRLGLFVLLTLILTGCQTDKFLAYILGFIVMRFIFVKKFKKGTRKK